MPFEAVIFDLDGTLLDTLEDIANTTNQMLTKHGFPAHDIKAYRYLVGDGVRTLIYRALPAESRQEQIIEKCLLTYQENYELNWKVNTKPYPGIHELLKALGKLSLKTAVLSNKKHNFTLRCIQEFFPDHHFVLVQGHSEGTALKPDPTSALRIAQKLDLAPERFLYLGDTAIDMQTALAAGMFPVGALWGFRTKEELIQSGAKAIIEHPLDFLKLI